MASTRSSRSRSSSRRSAPARHRGIGMLFWLCLAAVVVAVGIAAREPLKAAVAQLRGKPAPAAVTAPPSAPGGQAPARETPQVTIAPLTPRERTVGPGTPGAAPSTEATPGTAPGPAPRLVASPGAASPQSASPVEHPMVRKARLYFTAVDASGKLRLKSVIRSIPASDSPLTDTLQSLLSGPTAQELNLGLISMIPAEARLRGVVVKGDTAVLDFNEGFRFNAQGLDAMDAQLRQVVYAATEFPSVKKVQIRIEGAAVRYLGTEGMRLDTPLTRDSFQQVP